AAAAITSAVHVSGVRSSLIIANSTTYPRRGGATMRRMTRRFVAVFSTGALVLFSCAWTARTLSPQQPTTTVRPPMFEVDPPWPTIPNNWVLGEVTSVSVDSKDHGWGLHGPQS